MKAIAAIRTNRWTEEEERMLTSLREGFGDDVAVVFHSRPGDVEPPARVIDINRRWLKRARLRFPGDWGWRCGDYFYYALRTTLPEYDYYWLVEPDVLFSGNARDFFDRFSNNTDDLLGVAPGTFPDKSHPFLETLQHLEPCRAIFALTRFSGRALDRLLELRRANSQLEVSWRGFANDELFTFSHVHADPELTIGNLAEIAPDWFEGASFKTDPDILYEQVVNDPQLANKVFHPVKRKSSYKVSLATRLSNKNAFLRRMKPQLVHLSDEDIDEIAELARQNVLEALKSARA